MVDEGETTTEGITTVRLFGGRLIKRLMLHPQPALANRSFARIVIFLFSVVSLFITHSGNAAEHFRTPARPAFPRPLSDYHDREIPGLINKLVHRIKVEPFNLISTLIFFSAIVHTFLTQVFTRISRRYAHEFDALEAQAQHPEFRTPAARRRDKLPFRPHASGFVGGVEVVSRVRLLPLLPSAP